MIKDHKMHQIEQTAATGKCEERHDRSQRHTGNTWLHTARSPLDFTETGVSGSAVRKKSMGAGQ